MPRFFAPLLAATLSLALLLAAAPSPAHAATQAMALRDGFNFVCPYVADAGATSAALLARDEVRQVFRFDAATQSFAYHLKLDGGSLFGTPFPLLPGQGYVIRAATALPATVSLTGEVDRTREAAALARGFNFVGFPPLAVEPTANELLSAHAAVRSIFRWNPATAGFDFVLRLESGTFGTDFRLEAGGAYFVNAAPEGESATLPFGQALYENAQRAATLRSGAAQLETAAGVEVLESTAPPANGTGQIRFKGVDAVALAAGQVLAVTEGDGAVVRVKSSSVAEDGTVTLVTEPARLTDAYDALDLTFTAVLDDSTVNRSFTAAEMASRAPALAPDAAPSRAEMRRGIRHDLAGTVFYDNGTVKVEAVEGFVDVWTVVFADFHLLQDSDVKYALRVESSVTLKVTVSGAANLAGEIPIPGAAWSTVVKLGRANVKLNVGLFAGYAVDANAAASVTSAFTCAETITGSINYNCLTGVNGGQLPTRARSFTRSDPVIEAQADVAARAYLKPQVTLQFMGKTAVDLSFEAFARLFGEYHFHSERGHSYGWLFDIGASVSLATFPENPSLPISTAYDAELVLWSLEQHRRLVYGYVYGDPTGVTVTVSGQATDHPPGPFTRSVAPRADGFFVVSGVPQGEMTVRPGHAYELFSPASAPAKVGDYDLRDDAVRAQGPGDHEKSFEMQLVVDPAGPVTVMAGVPFTYLFTCHGGKGTKQYTWSATGLPPGLVIAPATGTVSGTVAAGANPSYTATLRASDDAGSVGQREVVFNLRELQIGNLAMPAATEGQPYTHAFSATGGTEPYRFTVTGLPAGLQAAADGRITGTPETGTAGTHTLTLRVEDATVPNLTAERTTSLLVQGPAAEIAFVTSTLTPRTLWCAAGDAASGATVTVSARGTIGPDRAQWSVLQLPAGATLGAVTATASGEEFVYSVPIVFSKDVARGDYTITPRVTWPGAYAAVTAPLLVRVFDLKLEVRGFSHTGLVDRTLEFDAAGVAKPKNPLYEKGSVYSLSFTPPAAADRIAFELVDGALPAPSTLPTGPYEEGGDYILWLNADAPGTYSFTLRMRHLDTGAYWLLPVSLEVVAASGVLEPVWLSPRRQTGFWATWYEAGDWVTGDYDYIPYNNTTQFSLPGVTQGSNAVSGALRIRDMGKPATYTNAQFWNDGGRFVLSERVGNMHAHRNLVDPTGFTAMTFPCTFYYETPDGNVARHEFTWKVPGKSEAVRLDVETNRDLYNNPVMD